jgi:two-component system response regulator AtoC
MGKLSISILAVDDEEVNLELLKRILGHEGYYVNTAPDGLAAINMLQTLPFDLVLLDIMMPHVDGIEVLKFVKSQFLDAEVIMLTGVQDVKTAVECMKLGAFYYIPKPYLASDLLALIDRALERKRLVRQNTAFRTELARLALSSNIVGQDRALLEMLEIASRAAPTDSTVLIQGASGTGKELVASFLHQNSLRKEQPFLALNCSSIPETLLESELFGHEKGAFTDATTSKQGLVEIANGGTLFLDEIGEMALTVQPKVLRFLQTGEFRRVGGNKNLKSDVRIVSATNKDLRQEAAAKRFREDLLFRINVITVDLPSLRERKDDIPLLVDHFLKIRAGNKTPKRLDAKALEMLMQYEWPGNIRELENVIERAAVLSRDEMIYMDDLALPLRLRPMQEISSGKSVTEIRAGSAISLAEIQRVHVARVLESVSWNKELAAKILGVSVKTLYAKIQAYGIVEP